MLSPEYFLGACQRQGVDLDDDIAKHLAHDEPHPLSAALWSPTRVMQAVAVAGSLRQKIPGMELADKKIRRTPKLMADTAARTLVEIINGSFQPSEDYDIPYFDRDKDLGVETCRATEQMFLKTVKALGRVSADGWVNSYGSHIVIDGQRPIMLRKAYIEASALTLAPVNIGGDIFPAGSILATRVRDENLEDIINSTTDVDVVSARDVDRAAFMRLSVFALTPAERSEIAYPLLDERPDEERLFRAITIEDIGQIAMDTASNLEPALVAA